MWLGPRSYVDSFKTRFESDDDFKERGGFERVDGVLSVDDQRERRCLNAAYRAKLLVDDCIGASEIKADDPVCVGAGGGSLSLTASSGPALTRDAVPKLEISTRMVHEGRTLPPWPALRSTTHVGLLFRLRIGSCHHQRTV